MSGVLPAALPGSGLKATWGLVGGLGKRKDCGEAGSLEERDSVPGPVNAD